MAAAVTEVEAAAAEMLRVTPATATATAPGTAARMLAAAAVAAAVVRHLCHPQ